MNYRTMMLAAVLVGVVPAAATADDRALPPCGPGMMYGPGNGAGNMPCRPGYGRGPGMMHGQDMGPGYGPGPGYGMGPGMMRGQGMGPGYGRGYGMGPGYDYGQPPRGYYPRQGQGRPYGPMMPSAPDDSDQ